MLPKFAPFLLRKKLRKQPRRIKALCLLSATALILYSGLISSRRHVQRELATTLPIQRETRPSTLAGKGNLSSTHLADTSREDLRAISAFASKNGNSITLVVVTQAYLELTLSWICNIQVGGFMPKGLLFLTSEARTHDVLKKIPETEAILIGSLNGGTEETGTEYKTPGYWRLMLDRTVLISNLLRKNIDVFLVETDSVWLRDPMPIIRKHTPQSDETQSPIADVLGILQSDKEINGGFLYIRSTAGTKALYRYIEHLFKREFIQQGMDKRRSPAQANRKGIQNDQTYLTRALFRDKAFRRRYKVKFRALDSSKFVLGNWYEKNTYYGLNAISPTVINNNFIIGIDNKIARARRFGHWFLDSRKKCSRRKVMAAIEKNNKAAAGLKKAIDRISKHIYTLKKNVNVKTDMKSEVSKISKKLYTLMQRK